jgi:membrane protein
MEKNAWRGAWKFCVAVARRFFDERCTQTAGSLTFTSLLALVPLLAVALAISTAFPVFDDAMATLQLFIFENFLPEAEGLEPISDLVAAFAEQAGRLTAIGLAFLAVTAVMLMLTIDDTLNRIFQVRRRRPLAQRILVYWSVLTLWPVLIGASLSMTAFVLGAAFSMLPFLFTWGALTVLYILVPYRHIDPRHALAGGLLAGIAFEAAKRGFALYLAKWPTYTLVYGAFATLPIFLLWLYLSWLVVLAGAMFTAMLPGYRLISADPKRGPGRELTEALDVLGVLARAQDEGRVLPLTRVATQAGLMPHRCELILERCAGLGWVAKSERDGWVLARDADTIRVADVYRAFVLDPEVIGERLGEHWKHVDEHWGTSLREISGKEESA